MKIFCKIFGHNWKTSAGTNCNYCSSCNKHTTDEITQFKNDWKKSLLEPIQKPRTAKDFILDNLPWIYGIITVITLIVFAKFFMVILGGFIRFLFFLP